MRTVSIRNLQAHKVRLLLTLVSVLLGTAFVAGSFVFTDTLKGSFDKIFTSATKNIDAQVQPRHDYDPGVPTSLVGTIRQLPGVRAVQPEITAALVLIDSHGNKVDSGGAPSQGGVWTSPADSISTPPTFVSGHAPDAVGQVVINQGAAKKGHLHTGDHAKIVLPNAATQDVTISGIYHTDTETGGYIGVLFTEQQAMQLFTDGSHLSALDIAGKSGVSEQTLTDRIAKVLPSTLEAKTGTQVRDDGTQGVASALSFVNYILFGFGFIALIVGTFIIYNTFSMLVAQRLRELALLRAIGADRKQIRRSVVLEAGIIGVIGSALGLAGGVGLAYGLHALLDALDLGLPSGGLVLSARTVIVSMLLGTAVTLLSAYAPARRAARIAPVAAMREEFASASAGSLRRRTWIGAAITSIGALATVGGLASSSAGPAASLTGLGLVGVCAGAMLLSPVLAGWIITPLGRLIGRPFGSVGRLARTNAVRNPRRTAATAFALTLGLVLVSGIAVVGASMKSSINHLFDENVTADYILTTQVELPVPAPAVAAAAKAQGVGSITQLHDLEALLDGKHHSGTGVDGPLAPVLRVNVQQGTADVSGHSMAVSKAAAKSNHWKLGSSVVLSRPGGASITETVSGIYKDDSLLGPWMVSGDVYRQLTPHNEWSDEVALVKAAPGADLGSLRSSLQTATDPFYVVKVQDRDQFKGSLASQVNGLLGLLYGLLGLAIVIAILGIINTLALSVVERRREIGMLRAVGMQRKQVRRTLYLESLLIAVFGAVLGLVLGVAYGSLFTRTLRDQGLGHLSVPWGQAILFLVLAAVVGVLAALWPGIRAARTSPLQAIRDS
ncbi:MAG: ABC transporter permease [Jatrophihabitantaceae bacterium]